MVAAENQTSYHAEPVTLPFGPDTNYQLYPIFDLQTRFTDPSYRAVRSILPIYRPDLQYRFTDRVTDRSYRPDLQTLPIRSFSVTLLDILSNSAVSIICIDIDLDQLGFHTDFTPEL